MSRSKKDGKNGGAHRHGHPGKDLNKPGCAGVEPVCKYSKQKINRKNRHGKPAQKAEHEIEQELGNKD